jgi:hypothetical protein
MLNDLGRARLLITGLGSVLPHDVALSEVEEFLWTVQFADGSSLSIRQADTPERLVLSASLGRAPGEKQFALYEVLLCYNLLWHETGGVRIGMDGPHGELVLVYDFFTYSPSASILRTVVLNVGDLARTWRSYIRGNDPPPDFHLDPGSAISFA